MSGEQSLSLEACIEGLLFVAGEPVPVERLASILDVNSDQVEAALGALARLYETRGLRIQRHGRRVQIVTAPEMADLVRALLGLDLSGKLSPAALETLAIIAYQQPVTRAQVEAVRGVNSDTVIRTLVNRGLVEEQGRLEQPGRPILYGTTFEFLQQFGLSSLDQLPPLQIEDNPLPGQ
ncbi:MAG: SMC-Scp complex subunit ScpB [Anaerolineae bacterium]|nr:SMC-Scp complex subunit ScpB [Anaerolineae bacterium]